MMVEQSCFHSAAGTRNTPYRQGCPLILFMKNHGNSIKFEELINLKLSPPPYKRRQYKADLVKRFFVTLRAMSPNTKVVRDDGSFILSTEDIQRRRMVFVSFFGLIMTAAYTVLQVYQLGMEKTGWLNIGTGVAGVMLCEMGLNAALWRERPQPIIRVLLLAFSALLWVEIGFAGGVTGYHIGILPILLGVSMWLQQKLNPAPTDATQAMIFAWMPWMFMFMLGQFASGLVIYWVANNVITFAQQYTIMRSQGVDVDILGNVKASFKRKKTS